MRSWNSTRWKIPIHLKLYTSIRSVALTRCRRTGAGTTATIFAILLVAGHALSASLPGVWQKRAPMPTARTEVAAAVLDGKIYVIGGYQKGAGLVEEYDPEKNVWRRRAALPKPLHHVGAAAVNGKIYVIGGFISGVGPVD